MVFCAYDTFSWAAAAAAAVAVAVAVHLLSFLFFACIFFCLLFIVLPAELSALSALQAMNANQSSMLILQETCTDAAGSLVVYAPVDVPAMHVVMNGGDSAYVALLPSGFAILPDGPTSRPPAPLSGGMSPPPSRVGGSLLTVAFQVLVNSLPTAKLTVESVETVNNLISCTVQKIKAALRCEN